MHQDDFRDTDTNRCKHFMPKNGKHMVLNVEDQGAYDFYRNIKCLKGNQYAQYAEYCGKETCVYYNPEINLVPPGHGALNIMEPDEAEKYLKNKK
jgi:hypothetical protein